MRKLIPALALLCCFVCGATDYTKYVGDTVVWTWQIKDTGSIPVNKMELIVGYDATKLKFVGAAKPANSTLPGGSSFTVNQNGTITLDYDNGVEANFMGDALELTFTAIGSGPCTIGASGSRAWNLAKTEIACTASIQDTLTIAARPGLMVMRLK